MNKKYKVISWVWLNDYCGAWNESPQMSEDEAWRTAHSLRGRHENIRVEEVKDEQARDIQQNPT